MCCGKHPISTTRNTDKVSAKRIRFESGGNFTDRNGEWRLFLYNHWRIRDLD